jgi:hypothetical protein
VPARLYGARNYERLVALKRACDPTNFFRLNQNIQPADRPRRGALPDSEQHAAD